MVSSTRRTFSAVDQRRRRWTDVMTWTRGDGVSGSDDIASTIGSRLCLRELPRLSGQNGVQFICRLDQRAHRVDDAAQPSGLRAALKNGPDESAPQVAEAAAGLIASSASSENSSSVFSSSTSVSCSRLSASEGPSCLAQATRVPPPRRAPAANAPTSNPSRRMDACRLHEGGSRRERPSGLARAFHGLATNQAQSDLRLGC